MKKAMQSQALSKVIEKQTIKQCTYSPTIVMAKIIFKKQGKLPTFLASSSWMFLKNFSNFMSFPT